MPKSMSHAILEAIRGEMRRDKLLTLFYEYQRPGGLEAVEIEKLKQAAGKEVRAKAKPAEPRKPKHGEVTTRTAASRDQERMLMIGSSIGVGVLLVLILLVWAIKSGGGKKRPPRATVASSNPVPYSNIVLNDGPIAYYPLAETGGTVAWDGSGNGNHGTINGDPVWSPGLVGNGLTFDGDGDWVQPAGPLNDAFTQRTVTLWARANSTSGTQVLFEEGGTTNGIAIRIRDGVLQAAVRDNKSQTSLTTPLADTEWHHVAAVFDAGAFALYVDGVQKHATTAAYSTIAEHGDAPGIGARNNDAAFGAEGTGDYFDGQIDEVAIYTTALSPADIAEQARFRPTPCSPPARRQ